MRSPTRTTMTCSALTATALAVTTLLGTAPALAEDLPAAPAADAAAPAGKLPLVDGDVVSYDEEAVASYDSPTLPDSAPTTGDDTPGATMGQYRKTVEEAKHLSPESETTMVEIADGELPDPEASAPAPAAGPAGSASVLGLASAWQPAGIQGMDVSGWQPSVNWSQEYANGARFAYIKATEGDSYRSPTFSSQYIGSHQVGMTRGAYHFAIPTRSSTGAKQADYFVDNGGGWSANGRTLPGLLDIEYNPYPAYGDICFNLSQTEMVNWIEGFSTRYEQRTGRLPAIYSTTDWWATCTGNTARFSDHPLFIASWTGTAGRMPNGWSTYDIWQYAEHGPFSGDSNVFGGSAAKLRDLAMNPAYRPIGGKAPTTATAPQPAAPQPAVPTTGFTDVPATHTYAKQIRWAGQTGTLTGWADGTFRPTQDATRAQMAAAAYKMAGSPAYTAPRVSPFRDVSTTHPQYKQIAWAKAKGHMPGSRTGYFRPANDMDRRSTAALLYRLAGKPAYTAPKTSAFKDVAPGTVSYKEMHWAKSTGIMPGGRSGAFSPAASTQRGAMSALLYRYTH